MDDKIVIELFKYLDENMETESRFLTSTPSTYIEIVGLLDKIAELRGISKEDNGREFNKIADDLKI